MPAGAERETQIRAALRRVLSSDAEGAVSDVARLVKALEVGIDFRPYADIFNARCQGKPGGCFWEPSDEDRALVKHGSRRERLRILEAAIRSGSVHLPNGLVIPRAEAVRTAAYDGLEELSPLSQQYLAVLSAEWKRRHGLDSVTAMFELCGRAASSADAPRLGVQRLSAMWPADLAACMRTDPGFHDAALEVARRTCEPDPLTRRPSPECRLVADIGQQQRDLEKSSAVISPTLDPCRIANQRSWVDDFECTVDRARTIARPGDRRAPLVEPILLGRDAYRPLGLDDCSLPEDTHGRWMPGDGDYFIVLYDVTLDPRGTPVDVSAGLVGHRTGERVRLRVAVMDRDGHKPKDAVIIRLSLNGGNPGVLFHIGSSTGCSHLQLLWNDRPGTGQLLPPRQEFEFVAGEDAGVAGLVPGEGPSRALVPWWRRAGWLEVGASGLRDAGEFTTFGTSATYALRIEGSTIPSENPLVARFKDRDADEDLAVILGPELVEGDEVIREAQRAFVLLRNTRLDGSPISFVCKALDDRRSIVGKATITMKALPATGYYLGAFTMIPDGDPDDQTAPGRYLFQPLVKLPGGGSAIDCARSASAN